MTTILIWMIAILLFWGWRTHAANAPSASAKFPIPKNRVVLLNGPIDDESANTIIAQLLYLEAMSKDQPIQLHVNSPGGSVTSALAILDTMERLQPTIRTHCRGEAHALAAIILAAGTPGTRSAEAHAVFSFQRIMASPDPSPQRLEHLIRVSQKLIDTTIKATGLPEPTVQELFDSERKLTAKEAQELGIIDRIGKP